MPATATLSPAKSYIPVNSPRYKSSQMNCGKQFSGFCFSMDQRLRNNLTTTWRRLISTKYTSRYAKPTVLPNGLNIHYHISNRKTMTIHFWLSSSTHAGNHVFQILS